MHFDPCLTSERSWPVFPLSLFFLKLRRLDVKKSFFVHEGAEVSGLGAPFRFGVDTPFIICNQFASGGDCGDLGIRVMNRWRKF